MNEYVIKVKLEDGTYAEFTAFAVDNDQGTIKEFDDYDLAKVYLQQLEQKELIEFMKRYFCFVSYSNTNQTMLISSFVNWYASLNAFDKNDFVKLLQKVVKINE